MANTLTAAAPIALVDHTGDRTRDRADTANERSGDHQPSDPDCAPTRQSQTPKGAASANEGCVVAEREQRSRRELRPGRYREFGLVSGGMMWRCGAWAF